VICTELVVVARLGTELALDLVLLAAGAVALGVVGGVAPDVAGVAAISRNLPTVGDMTLAVPQLAVLASLHLATAREATDDHRALLAVARAVPANVAATVWRAVVVAYAFLAPLALELAAGAVHGIPRASFITAHGANKLLSAKRPFGKERN